ncbi:hypothetical protein B0T26DRAFT_682191 [Lasiosphaeria miniovina]|uniref:Uncharacterized protein n=1 Tax=Lasiosphaeria miniovina TaxID=1954250 RepID=A0AA40DG19_9PEZI|nr:uncharacterized protein B0T26DRAFT_682191 [Lasiosphaeria miniovina]KAK0702124.1 hypothetical protein B0T26DRAFT_682191 [Lasiosphaeria miniovina]
MIQSYGPHAIFTSWEISFAAVEQSAPEAGNLLQPCAFLNKDDLGEPVSSGHKNNKNKQLDQKARKRYATKVLALLSTALDAIKDDPDPRYNATRVMGHYDTLPRAEAQLAEKLRAALDIDRGGTSPESHNYRKYLSDQLWEKSNCWILAEMNVSIPEDLASRYANHNPETRQYVTFSAGVAYARMGEIWEAFEMVDRLLDKMFIAKTKRPSWYTDGTIINCRASPVLLAHMALERKNRTLAVEMYLRLASKAKEQFSTAPGVYHMYLYTIASLYARMDMVPEAERYFAAVDGSPPH